MLQIDGGGFRTAATAFVEGNQLGALAYDRLTGVLAGCGGMAGDDATSAEFAAAYDEAAAAGVAALGDLVAACARVGHLTHASLANHAHANARAVVGRSVVGGSVVYDGGWLPDAGDDAGYVAVLPWRPPTATGSTGTAGASGKVAWILDHLEGFVWPSADVSRVREAAAGWRVAAGALAEVAACCDSAVRGFWLERSPEIPLAVDATLGLKAQVGGLADSFAGLAVACDSYADAVQAKHAEILELARWLLEQVVEGVVISVALGALTGGIGTGAGLGAVAARVAGESPRFTALLDALRGLASGYAAGARAARESIGLARLRLGKFKNAAVARSAAQGERGEMKLVWTEGETAKAQRLRRVRDTFEDPSRLDPQDLRGLSRDDLRDVLSEWRCRESSRGEGLVYEDPVHRGRQIRIMDGYPGNRRDPITHGPYAVVSQNGDAMKVPLEGNPAQ